MPHDDPDHPHWHEPTAGQNAGYGKFKRAPMPYDKFMEAEGIPVFRGIGVRRVQDLPLGDWKRLGGRGSYIQLYGTEGLWGLYVVEVPPRGALNIERHIYEKNVLVVEGRGSTEVWQEGQSKRQTFEWQTGSLFTVPLNATHRFVNATSSPALLLCGTTAPNVMNLYDNVEFIFNCPFQFTDRYAGADDYFKTRDDIEPDPIRGLAMRRTNFIPDIIRCELPLDNRRSPGYRRVEPNMGSNRFYLWIGEHQTGRYSKAHKHESAAVLICLKGKGYTYTWPAVLGTQPWAGGFCRQGLAPGLRARRSRLRSPDERRVVPPALRRFEGGPARHRLAWAQQSAIAPTRPPRRATHGLRRHRPQEGRRRHPLLRRGSSTETAVRGPHCAPKAWTAGWIPPSTLTPPRAMQSVT